MGTAKRERQKANRQLRLEQLAKEARQEKSKKVAMRVTIGVLVFVALVGGLYLANHKSSSSSAATTTSLASTADTGLTATSLAVASTTTVDPNAPTTSTLPKPKVQIPTTIPTTLKVTTLIDGSGTAAKAGDTVTVNYIGVLSSDGTEFDNSYDRGQPFTFVLGQGSVIKGWDQGLVGVKAGSRVQLDIPSDLAYGTTGQGSIKPNAALTFVVDLLAVSSAG